MGLSPSPPNQPSDAVLARTLREILTELDQTAEGSDFAEEPKFFLERAIRYRQLGALYYARGASMTDVAKPLRVSTVVFQNGCMAGATTDAFDLWDAFHTALACGAHGGAHFLASLPPEVWIDEESPPWPAIQCLAAFALFRGEERLLPRLLEQLRAFVIEEPLPKESETFVPEAQNYYHLLTALYERDGTEFHRRLRERMAIREKIYRGDLRDDPEGLLDLPGLGLCRLAGSRGIGVEVSHVYLPLQVLSESPCT